MAAPIAHPLPQADDPLVSHGPAPLGNDGMILPPQPQPGMAGPLANPLANHGRAPLGIDVQFAHGQAQRQPGSFFMFDCL